MLCDREARLALILESVLLAKPFLLLEKKQMKPVSLICEMRQF